jgi:hypothetical protein
MNDRRGYILDGDESRRFGNDKVRAPWRGSSLIAWNAQLLQEAGMGVSVVAGRAGACADLGQRINVAPWLTKLWEARDETHELFDFEAQGQRPLLGLAVMRFLAQCLN